MDGWTKVAIVAVATVVLLVFGIRALLRGRRVPTKAKLVMAGAILWLLSPLDPLPDVALPIGLFDDLAVLIAAIKYVMDHLQPPESAGPPANPSSRDQRLDQHDAIEPLSWRYTDKRDRVTDDRERPGPT